jgi:two-component system cell cycle response regulator CtrA
VPTYNVEAACRAIGIRADDYLTKPFHKNELVARIHAIVRRSRGHAQLILSGLAGIEDKVKGL